MIVADASLLANLLIPDLDTASGVAVIERDDNWHAPSLWRSELRNTLLKYIRAGSLAQSRAQELFNDAAALIGERERQASTFQTLHAAITYPLSAYDAEYVALALELGVRVVTFDKKLVVATKGIALSPEDFLR